MGALNILAEQSLGYRVLDARPTLRHALTRLDARAAATRPKISPSEVERIAAIGRLIVEYWREEDADEKKNILHTLEELTANEPLKPPDETVEDWHERLKTTDAGYAKADAAAQKRGEVFLKKYFSLRAQAGLATQADVARKSGLSRSYVAVIETGEHVPQQKTLQKLARALGVDVAELL